MRMYSHPLGQLARHLLLTRLVTSMDLHLYLEAQHLADTEVLLRLADAQNGNRHRRKQLTRGKAALHDAYATSPMMMAL